MCFENSRMKLRLGEAGERNENFSITNFRKLAILKLKRHNYRVQSTVKREFKHIEEEIAEQDFEKPIKVKAKYVTRFTEGEKLEI